MKIFRIPALSLHAAALGACYCCSSPETGRSQVYSTDGLSVNSDCMTSAGIAAMLATHGCNGCHSGQGSVTFATAADLDRIVAGAIGDAACGGTVITPGMASTSTLYLRLAGTGPAACDRMPKDASPKLTVTELTCVQTWLNGLQPSP